MKKLAQYAKFVVALVGAAATSVATAAVPNSWKAVAAIIATFVTAVGVLITKNSTGV